jgi:hypothetical protein
LRFTGNHSYVWPGTAGNYDLQAGDAFVWGVESFSRGAWIRAEVVAIDDASLTATLRFSYRPATRSAQLNPLRTPAPTRNEGNRPG